MKINMITHNIATDPIRAITNKANEVLNSRAKLLAFAILTMYLIINMGVL